MRFFRTFNPLFFWALALILAMSGCSKNDPNPADQVLYVPVGMAVSLTGNFSPYGIIQKNGFLMAINELNNDWYIPGVQLVPVIMDDKSSPDTCRNIFREMISAKKVLIIVGPTSSNSAFVADTVAQNHKVTVMGISNTVPGITEMGDYIFRNSLPESSVIPNTIRVTQVKLGYSKVAVVYGNDDPYTIGAYNAFKSAIENTPGLSIVSTEVVHKGDTLFTDQLSRIKASNPEVIVLAALVNEAARLMVQGRQLGIPDSVKFIGGNSFNTSQLWQKAGQAAQGAICGTAWIDTGLTPGNSLFVSRYTKLYGSKPDQFAAQAYTSIQIIADAIGRCNPLNSQTLRNSLAGTQNLQTILGTFSFDINRNPVHEPVVQELINGTFWLFR